jgi:hypothetical protein
VGSTSGNSFLAIDGLAVWLREWTPPIVVRYLSARVTWEIGREIDLAHTRAAKDPTFRVFPVLLPGLPDPFDESYLPPFMKTRTWVDLRKGLDDPRAFHSLLCGIKKIAPGPGPILAASDHRHDAPDICPYRGLQVFNEEDAPFYFGRAAEEFPGHTAISTFGQT